MSIFGGSSGGGDAGIVPGNVVAPPASHPFINWHSPVSVLTSPLRALRGGGEAAGSAIENAAKGVPALLHGAYQETERDLASRVEALSHGSAAHRLTGLVPVISPEKWQAFRAGQQTINNGGNFDQAMQTFEKGAPLTGGFFGSGVRAGQDVEQVARAGGNTLLPGQPLGSGVGQLGSGAALLGTTALARAAQKGGGGVLPKLLEDAANASLISAPAASVIGKASEDAAAEAAARASELADLQKAGDQATKDAQTQVVEAAKRADQARAGLEATRQAASMGDPMAGAQYVAQDQMARGAAEALRQAQDYAAQVASHHAPLVSAAQEAADLAQQRADTLAGHADTAKLVHDLGIKTANSPFAAMGAVGEGALSKAVLPAAHALVGSELGQQFLQPVLDRAGAYAADLRQRAEERNLTRAAMEQGQQKQLNEGATLRRGFEEAAAPTSETGPARRSLFHPLGGARPGLIPNEDAQAVSIMALTRDDAQLRQLMLNLPDSPKLVARTFSKAFEDRDGNPIFTPEQIQLAMDTFDPRGPQTPEAAELLAAIPKVQAGYEGAAAQQAENYARLRGEVEPVIAGRNLPGSGAFAQVEHNLQGEGPRIEALDQWRRAVAEYEKRRGRFEKGQELAGRQLERAVKRFEGLGLTAEDVKDPKALVARIMGPAVATAQVALTGEGLQRLLADDVEPRIRRIAQRVADGKLPPEIGTRDLASEILKLTVRDPATLSSAARALVEHAGEQGIGEVPKGLPDIARSVKPTELLGAGRERLRAGTVEYDRAVRDLARAQTAEGAAGERLAEPGKPPSGNQLRAAKRLVDARVHLDDLQERLAAAHPLEGEEAVAAHEAALHEEARATVRELRTAIKEWHANQADLETERLRDEQVPSVNPTPPVHTEYRYAKNRGGNKYAGARRAVQVPDWSNGGWDFASHVMQEIDPKFLAWGRRNGFFSTSAPSPEELIQQWNPSGAWQPSYGSEGASMMAQEIHPVTGRPYNEYAPTIESWMERVRGIYDDRQAAREAIDEEDYLASSRAAATVLDETWHMHPLAGKIAEVIGGSEKPGVNNSIEETAKRLVPVLREAARLEQAGETGDAAARVQAALEADRHAEEQGAPSTAGRASLSPADQAEYDRQVLADQTRIQQAKVGILGERAEAAPNAPRIQGQREGALLGRAQELTRQGEAGATRGDTAMRQGQAIVGQAPELTQEAAARVAGPIGRLYAKAGAAQRDVVEATRQYAMQTRALERLDEGLAKTRQQLMDSIDAQPRAMRPVLETGRRINEQLLPIADEADATLGAGAGDVYRAAAAQAVVTADFLRKAGIDPQYVIGSSDVGLRNPDIRGAGGAEILPSAGKTGQRIAGRGQIHATRFADLSATAGRRLRQIINNETVQDINDKVGGPLAEQLAQRIPGLEASDVEQMSHATAVKAMHDGGLTAWDRRTGAPIPDAQVTLDTHVIPTHVWKEYSKYNRVAFAEHVPFLKTYDALLKHWKASALYLTGRWHSNLILGHAVMAMVGGDIGPRNYWNDIQIARRLERLRVGLGNAEDQAFVESHATPAQLEGLRIAGGHTPGAAVERGYTATEFGTGLPAGAPGFHPIERGWRFQSHLDNINRTAVWLAKLEQGLDARGLADFRAAYPDLAHLSDAQIKNEAAIRLSIRTIGEYTNYSPTEQELVKRIVPFYPWLRHITKLATNLAIHDPIRTAWMLHLGLMFSPKQSGVDWLAPSYDLGNDRWYTPPHWDPFESITRTTDPENPFGAVSPLINAASLLGTGWDLQRNKEATRAPGTASGGLLGVAGAPGYLLGSMLPQVKALREAIPALVGHKAIARYQTGQPVIVSGQSIPSNDQQVPGTNVNLPGILGPLVPLLGAGSQSKIQAAQIVAAQQKRDAAAQRAAQRYATQRAAAAAAS